MMGKDKISSESQWTSLDGSGDFRKTNVKVFVNKSGQAANHSDNYHQEKDKLTQLFRQDLDQTKTSSFALIQREDDEED